MNPDNTSKPGARDNDNTADANLTSEKTPSTDMQPEDTGTPDSGNTDRTSPAGNAMKQTGKTPAERGER